MESHKQSVRRALRNLSAPQLPEYQQHHQQSFPQKLSTGVVNVVVIGLVFVGLFLVFPLSAAQADTIIPAMEIMQDTTWTLAESPYIITGDVTVRHATPWEPVATLTLEAGITLRFEPGTGLFIGQHAYYGALVAQGTPDAPITFTSNAASPRPGDWKGVYLTDYTQGDLPLSNTASLSMVDIPITPICI